MLPSPQESGKVCPVFYDVEQGVSFAYVQYSNLYIMAVTRCNSNAAAALLFLHKVVDIFRHYFAELEEESLRDNFVIAYELLDEVMDFGYPQFTEAKILSEYIKTEAYKVADVSPGLRAWSGSVDCALKPAGCLLIYRQAPQPPSALTGVVGWRPEGLKYKKNEVRPSLHHGLVWAALEAARVRLSTARGANAAPSAADLP